MCANDRRDMDERVEIMRRIGWIGRRHFQLNTARLEETGLGGGQVPVLMELRHWGELSQRELADKVRVTPATMSGMLKRMERAGFICRAADENDARISRVRLTEAGKAQCEYAHQVFDEVAHELLAGLGAEDIDALHRLLKNVVDQVGGSCCRTESSKKE